MHRWVGPSTMSSMSPIFAWPATPWTPGQRPRPWAEPIYHQRRCPGKQSGAPMFSFFLSLYLLLFLDAKCSTINHLTSKGVTENQVIFQFSLVLSFARSLDIRFVGFFSLLFLSLSLRFFLSLSLSLILSLSDWSSGYSSF